MTTVGLIAGGFWWFTRNTGFNLNKIIYNNTNKPQAATEQPSGKTFTSIQNVPTGLFNYGGSTSWAPIRLTIDTAITAARPEFRLRYTVELFVQDILGGQPLGSQVELVSTTTQALQNWLLVLLVFIMLLPQRWFLNAQLDPCRWGGRQGNTLLPTKNHLYSRLNVLVNETN